MGKFFGIVSMAVAAFVGHFVYGEYQASQCLATVDNFKAAYQKNYGNPNRSEIVKLLKTATKHCEAGEHEEAYNLLQTKATVCRLSDDC